MVLIDQGMNFNGCEVIAVNNALYLMGYEPSMAELVRIFEENDVVVGNDFIDGYFGSNPFGLDRIFDAVGVDSHEVSVNDLSQRGLYIISFWNSTDYDSMLHTIAMQSDGKGNYITYNNAYDDIDRNFPINNNNLYIIGYKLFPRKLINI